MHVILSSFVIKWCNTQKLDQKRLFAWLHNHIINIYTWSHPEILQFDQFINIFSVIIFNRQIMYWSLLLYKSKLILSTLKLPQLLQTSLHHLIVVISLRHHMKIESMWRKSWVWPLNLSDGAGETKFIVKYFSLLLFSFLRMQETWRQSHEYSPGTGISV